MIKCRLLPDLNSYEGPTITLLVLPREGEDVLFNGTRHKVRSILHVAGDDKQDPYVILIAKPEVPLFQRGSAKRKTPRPGSSAMSGGGF